MQEAARRLRSLSSTPGITTTSGTVNTPVFNGTSFVTKSIQIRDEF